MRCRSHIRKSRRRRAAAQSPLTIKICRGIARGHRRKLYGNQTVSVYPVPIVLIQILRAPLGSDQPALPRIFLPKHFSIVLTVLSLPCRFPIVNRYTYQGGRFLPSAIISLCYFVHSAFFTPSANTSWNALTLPAMSPPNTAEPATMTSAPAATMSAVLVTLAPPSISSSQL